MVTKENSVLAYCVTKTFASNDNVIDTGSSFGINGVDDRSSAATEGILKVRRLCGISKVTFSYISSDWWACTGSNSRISTCKKSINISLFCVIALQLLFG